MDLLAASKPPLRALFRARRDPRFAMGSATRIEMLTDHFTARCGQRSNCRLRRNEGQGSHHIRRSMKKTLKGATQVSMLTHGCCERVARERAGGERGLIFACQKENRVHLSNKAAR